MHNGNLEVLRKLHPPVLSVPLLWQPYHSNSSHFPPNSSSHDISIHPCMVFPPGHQQGQSVIDNFPMQASAVTEITCQPESHLHLSQPDSTPVIPGPFPNHLLFQESLLLLFPLSAWCIFLPILFSTAF